MSNEVNCKDHGPYDASLGTCPRCAGGSSPGVVPSGVPSAQSYSDEDETVLPGQAPRMQPTSGEEGETVLPQRGSGILEDEEKTQLPDRVLNGRRNSEYDPGVTLPPRSHEETGLMGWLIVKKSGVFRRGYIERILPDMIFGRDLKKVDVLVDDEGVSSLHARIQVEEEQFVLRDLGSTYGTWVNDEQIDAATTLKQDDEIKMGDTIFVLKTLE